MTRDMVRHPAILHVLEGTLRQVSPTYQIHFTGVMHMMQGQAQQVFHRDAVQNPNTPVVPVVVVATMWAATDFTRENGATLFIPSSHKWYEDQKPTRKQIRIAAMRRGSVLIYAGNLIHAGGRCASGERTGVALQYTIGTQRQEENQYCAVPFELARTFDDDLCRLMGYDLAARNWGYVDQLHPLDWLKGRATVGGLAPPGYALHERPLQIYSYTGPPSCDHRYGVTLDGEDDPAD